MHFCKGSILLGCLFVIFAADVGLVSAFAFQISSTDRRYRRYQQQVQTRLKMAPVGFVGIGIMGEGMAARLVSEGVAGGDEKSPLIVWNRTTSKCTALKEKFPDKNIIIKDTAKEVVEACEITYSILSTPEVSQIVFEGDNGVLAGVSKGKSIVDCATLAEEDMKRMSEAVVQKGGRFLEAPVSGSKVPAATGTLIFLCAGSEELFNEIKDSGLKAMGKASHFFGTQVGFGTRSKLVVNSLMGTMMVAFGEAIALSESVGLDPTKMIEIIGQGAIQSPVYALKGPKMIVKNHAPNFPLKHAHKDMALASKMAKDACVEYSVMDQAETIFRAARSDEGLKLADLDMSAVFEKIHEESSSDFSKKRKADKI
ncbi:Putative oxidoreductase GLYR1 [Seminavis robusta]|uniref:Oxidoreductase GLYR1 n=1 Tax=Seminavis robusta TaxID=568900 RepID=A0A9N8DY51_9STRA|nr:Putative oxidoreductase GLYR1 [Seminavis robusta]|eukprot:Sro383_g131330.1 Putative oxidoreductase GLYR1 (369) ;mRNA; r:40529-41929